MKVLIAMNAFKGSLSSHEACDLVTEGFRRGFPEAQVGQIPLADGGDGTIDVLVAALGGYVETVEVTGPYKQPVNARVGLLSDDTAVIESAACSGLALAQGEKPNVCAATSQGVGELMVWAAKRGVKRILVGVGGTAMNDGGIGMVQAAGGKVLDESGCQVDQGVYGLKQVFRVELGNILSDFRDIEILAICDVANQLTGPQGATYVYGPQKGINAHQLSMVDSYMNSYGAIIGRDLGRDPRHVAMAGAGGGLAAALWAFLGARLVEGANFILEQTGCLDQIRMADFIITGEGRVDSQTEQGKVPYAVAKAGFEYGATVAVLGGSIDDSVLHGYPEEFGCVFDSTVSPCSIESAIENTKSTLPFMSEQIARLLRAVALKYPAGHEVSAGGVVIRNHHGKTQVLMIRDRFGFLALPKGHVVPKEPYEQAALREVREETGLECEIIARAGSHTYQFFDNGCVPKEKTVVYYVMKQTAGIIKPQLSEVAGVLWVDQNDLDSIRTYPNLYGIINRSLGVFADLIP